MKKYIFWIIALALMMSCKGHEEESISKPIRKKKEWVQKKMIPNDSVIKVVDQVITPKKAVKRSVIKIHPVFGYRFIIDGDFDGDGVKEQLVEHFYSLKTNKETNKFYENLPDYGDLVTLTMKKDPYSFVSSTNKNIKNLEISQEGQLLGLSYLKNEGDLNGDGTDEVSYVVNWADWSNLNHWHLMTYRNQQWEELYTFSIWDWQLPDLPDTFNEYGMFGLQNKYINAHNAKANKAIEKDLMEFKGLIKKIATDSIEIYYMTNDAELDTLGVNLKNCLKKEDRSPKNGI
ncbi:hypothetical protein OX284_013590 [Flavobacterium sp. SUN046]|uniref:hypothetical protein n=1 Tax=Flavobacterium sp. SUN046 TaxID=3002440 RepID=UPI002DB7C583|nr:hypothetical protein [Flavobacterium sp. SUN046]MEC4050470.1 hypothetical protein [Flavobacterium sp. SUN046]